MKTYIFDLEMTVYNQEELKTDVWLAYFEDYDSDEHYYFRTIDQVMDFILSQNKVNFFAKNLGGFDGLAIWDWLSNNNYVHKAKGSMVADLDFFALGDSSKFTVYTRQLNGELWSVSLIDTNRFIKGTVEEFGRWVGIEKGETPLIPYGTKYTPEKKDYSYVKGDVKIVKAMMKAWRVVEVYENRMSSLSSYAYQTAISGKAEIELERIEDYEPAAICTGWRGEPNKQKRYSKRSLAKVERVRKPPYQFVSRPTSMKHLEECDKFLEETRAKLAVTVLEEDRQLLEQQLEQGQRYRDNRFLLNQRIYYNDRVRLSYRGGLLHINRETQDKWIDGHGVILDINSRHPHTYSTERLPHELYGVAYSNLKQMQEELDDFVYFVEFDRLKATVKPGKMPILKARKDDTLNYNLFQKHVPESIDYKRVIMTQVDYEYMLENYDFEVVENPSFIPYTVHYELMGLLKKHCDFWYNRKVEAGAAGDSLVYNQAKGMLNNVTGFLAVNPDNFERLGNKSSQSNVAVASFINAHARVKLARTANQLGLENIYYANADSLHLKLPARVVQGEPDQEQLRTRIEEWLGGEGLDVDDQRLGAWKIEAIFKQAKYIAFMTYGYETIDGKWKTKVTGLNKIVPKDDFETGTMISYLKPVRADGGILLIDSDFVLGGKQYLEQILSN